jgi:hypothetical protein
MARKHDHSSKPNPRTSPASDARRVVVAAHGNASVGHNKHSGRRGPRRLGIADPANGANLKAPGAGGPAVAPGIGPGGYLSTN